MNEFTASEVAAHNKSSDIWMIIEGKVYDVTDFLQEHPGGEEVLQELAGQDATESFEDIGHSQDARDMLKNMLVGCLSGSSAAAGRSFNGEKPRGSKSKSPSYSAFYALLPVLVAGLAYYHFTSYK